MICYALMLPHCIMNFMVRSLNCLTTQAINVIFLLKALITMVAIAELQSI